MFQLSRIIKLVLLLLFLFSLFPKTATDEEEARLLDQFTTRREVTGIGFHLQLETSFTFQNICNEEDVTNTCSNSSSSSSCEVILKEKLPPQAFVDPDQVKELEKFSSLGLGVFISNFNGTVDIEKPAELSNSCPYVVTFKKITYLNSSSLVRISKIPFHLRYQAPNVNRYANVEITVPELICSTCSLLEKDFKLQNDDNNLCAKEFGSKYQTYQSVKWDPVIVLSTPVGDPEQIQVILNTTILVVSLATILIIWVSWYS